MAFIDKDNLTIVKRKKRKGEKELIKVLVSVKMTVEASEAKAGAPIAPILGQFQINTVEFCKRFNEMSSEYEVGLPLSVKVLKKSNGKVEIDIKPPINEYLFWIFLDEGEQYELKLEELYDLVCIRAGATKQKNLIFMAKSMLRFLTKDVKIKL